MRKPRNPAVFRVICGLPVLFAAACSGGHAPPAPPPAGGPELRTHAAHTPLECGEGSGQTATAEIGEQGGTVAVRGHALAVPANAVSTRTPFTLTEERGPYVRVEVGPHGTRFGRNATLTLSYARCPGNPGAVRQLTILEVRSGTVDVIRALPSVVDSVARTVSTPALDHLSGYLIGGN
ncbi:MAG: hypothetical protein KY467_09135 [Gemmatimonadetes bacterium]|nr:hypothetical protein [Gemmatimonadota bacterium]